MSGPELSPAERYALAKQRTRAPMLETFRAEQRFDLDPFQVQACAALEAGRSVLVAAPTGAGKTIVADFAVYLAMQHPSAKVFYTAPIKALSNQKYADFVEQWGSDAVGLLTGDTSINPRARILVMTTEVLRNMIYAESDLLPDLAYVVMDEVHYLADRFRGAVWEEVIIHLPEQVRLVSLSATVSNAEEFGDWLQTVRGDTEVIVSEERPVPLHQHVLLRGSLIDLFDGTKDSTRVNPELLRLVSSGTRGYSRRGRPQYGPERRVDRAELIATLGEAQLLPAIFFIFSRAGCDQAVRQAVHSRLRLTNADERKRIRDIVEERTAGLPDADLAALDYWDWLDGLERGVAAHHAGLIPVFKETIEELFQRKLLRVVFATETLALGVNMPARSVVLEKLQKFNGESRVPITPGEYTQLTGRAGRRGIDTEGHSIIVWSNTLEPQSVASLASRRSYPLQSSFKPSYNMAVNLIERFGAQRTRELLESSFAQFQADRGVVDLAKKVRQQEHTLAGYAKAMGGLDSDFAAYAALRREISDLEKRNRGARGAAAKRIQDELGELRKQLRAHPAHQAPDREDRSRWAERWWRLRRDTDRLVREIEGRTGAIARIFDRVSRVLVARGYIDQWDDEGMELSLNPKGKTLQRIYGERDLLVAEALRLQLWDRLDAPGLAAMACALVYEPRREDSLMHERQLPGGQFRVAFDDTIRLWSELDDLEQDNGLPGSEPPSAALSGAMQRWAKGASLDAVLRQADLAAGDFVRWAKQVIDLLDQLTQVAHEPVARNARVALDSVRRGIVAYSSVG